jgi:hypothetical protein
VNNTVSSDLLTRSKTDEKQQILSYVQQRRRKREEETLKPPPWASFTWALNIQDDDELNVADIIPTAGSDRTRVTASWQSSSTQLLNFSDFTPPTMHGIFSTALWLASTVPSMERCDWCGLACLHLLRQSKRGCCSRYALSQSPKCGIAFPRCGLNILQDALEL